MRALPAALTLTLALAFAYPAAAQGEPLPVSSDIVVQRTLKQEEASIQALVRQVIGPINSTRPIPRFHNPLCLAVSGVNDAFIDSFGARIIENAQIARTPVETGDCKPNALVIFTSDSRKELEKLRKTQRSIFGNLPPSAITRMLKSRDPAFAWQATQVLGMNGMPLIDEDGELPDNRVFGTSGRLANTFKTGVAGAVVVIDINAIDGKTATQLADYASLRLLAPTGEIKEIAEGSPETIMTLFLDPANAPGELTAFDLAYLRGVYQIAPNVPASNVYGQTTRNAMRGRAR